MVMYVQLFEGNG